MSMDGLGSYRIIGPRTRSLSTAKATETPKSQEPSCVIGFGLCESAGGFWGFRARGMKSSSSKT